MSQTQRWDALAETVRCARVLLGHENGAAWAASIPLAQATVYRLEKARPVSDLTLIKIEEALGWEPGRAKRILRGELGGTAELVIRTENWDVLGAAVDRARLEAGHTNASRWAEDINLSETTVLNLINGKKVRPDSIKKAVEALGKDMAWALAILQDEIAPEKEILGGVPKENLEALAGAVNRARIAAGFNSARTFAPHAKIDPNTAYAIERGEAVSRTTLVKIELALKWPAGTTTKILSGELVPDLSPLVTQESGRPRLLPPGYEWGDFTRDEQLYLLGMMDAMKCRRANSLTRLG